MHQGNPWGLSRMTCPMADDCRYNASHEEAGKHSVPEDEVTELRWVGEKLVGSEMV
jgi:hypothetical protein